MNLVTNNMTDTDNSNDNIPVNSTSVLNNNNSVNTTNTTFLQGLVDRMLGFIITPTSDNSNSSVDSSVNSSVIEGNSDSDNSGNSNADTIAEIQAHIKDLQSRLLELHNSNNSNNKSSDEKSDNISSIAPDIPPIPASIPDNDIKSQFMRIYESNPRQAAKWLQENMRSLSTNQMFTQV